MPANTSGNPAEQRPDVAWTPRQKQVLDLLARGYSNAQVAEALGVSLDGAKWHVREIMAILAVDSREDAADYWRARNGLRTRLRRGIAVALASDAARWSAGIAAAGVVAVVVTTIVLLAGSDEAPPPAVASETASVIPDATATPASGYLCPFDEPEVCDFAFEVAAAFHPPDYGLSNLVEGSDWAAPEYLRQLEETVAAAFPPGDPAGIRLVAIGCPIDGDLARCGTPGFVLTFADFDPFATSTAELEAANVVLLVFESSGVGARPILTGPLREPHAPATTTAIYGGNASCSLLGLETRIQQCNGLSFRSTLFAPADPTGASIAGLPVRELTAGDPVPFPDGITLYFNRTCYGCEGGISTFRASSVGGVLAIEELGPLPQGSVRGGSAYYMSRAIDANGRRMAMGVCDQFDCGGIAEADPGARATLWISEDSGATWTNHGDLPIWSQFDGFYGDQLMASTWDYASQTRARWLYPSRDPWPVPLSLASGYAAPWQSPGGQTLWTQAVTGTAHQRVYDSAGNLLVDRIDPAYDTSLMAMGTDGTLYLRVGPSSSRPNAPPADRLVATTPSGDLLAAFRWEWGDLRLTSSIAVGVFIGNALFGPYPPLDGPVNFRPALIDLHRGTVQPIAGLPPDPTSGIGGYAFTIAAVPAR